MMKPIRWLAACWPPSRGRRLDKGKKDKARADPGPPAASSRVAATGAASPDVEPRNAEGKAATAKGPAVDQAQARLRTDSTSPTATQVPARRSAAARIAELVAGTFSGEELDLSGAGLADADVSAIAAALASNTKLRSLVLFDNAITDIGGTALRDALVTNATIRNVNLRSNPGLGEALRLEITALVRWNGPAAIAIAGATGATAADVNGVYERVDPAGADALAALSLAYANHQSGCANGCRCESPAGPSGALALAHAPVYRRRADGEKAEEQEQEREEGADNPLRWLFLGTDRRWWVSDTADKDDRRGAGYANSVDKVGLAGAQELGMLLPHEATAGFEVYVRGVRKNVRQTSMSVTACGNLTDDNDQPQPGGVRIEGKEEEDKEGARRDRKGGVRAYAEGFVGTILEQSSFGVECTCGCEAPDGDGGPVSTFNLAEFTMMCETTGF